MKLAFPVLLVGDELAKDVTAEACSGGLARSKGISVLGKVCGVAAVVLGRRGAAAAMVCPSGLEGMGLGVMNEFFFSSSRALFPVFVQIAQMGLILPRIPPPAPVLYSAVTHAFQGYVRTQNTPKPTSKHPFSWPELESGQNELLSWKIWTSTEPNV